MINLIRMWLDDRRWNKAKETDRIREAERQKAEEQELKRLLPLAENGNAEAEQKLYNDFWPGSVQNSRLKRRLLAVRKRVDIRLEYEKYHDDLSQAVAEWMDAKRTRRELKALSHLVQLYRKVEFSENLIRLRSELRLRRRDTRQHLIDLVTADYNELLAQGHNSAYAFGELRDLIRRTHHSSLWSGGEPGRWYRINPETLLVPPLRYPQEWDELAARHLAESPVELFRALGERRTGDLHIMARRAMHANDREQLQIALQCCTAYEREPNELIMVQGRLRTFINVLDEEKSKTVPAGPES